MVCALIPQPATTASNMPRTNRAYKVAYLPTCSGEEIGLHMECLLTFCFSCYIYSLANETAFSWHRGAMFG